MDRTRHNRVYSLIKARLNLYLNYVAVAALALLPLGGCTAEEEWAVSGETLSVSMEGSPSRITLDPGTGGLTWAAGDQIAILTTSTIRTCDVDVSTSQVIVPLGAGETRQGYAVYPASSVSTLTTSSVVVTYPASYDISDNLTSEHVPIPMVAVNSSGSTTLAFCHVGGLLRIVATLPAGTATVEVTTTGDPIVGNARVTNPGTTQATSTITGGSNSVTFTVHATGLSSSHSVILNIPVPCGSYTGITVTAYDSSHAEIVSFTDEAGRFVDHRIASLLDISSQSSFSVSSTASVVLAPGNLMAKISSDYHGSFSATASEWKFGDPWEYIGGDTSLGNYRFAMGYESCAGQWIDLFAWQGKSSISEYRAHGILQSTSNNESSYMYHGDNPGEPLYDGCWNGLPITNGGGYNWRPLTESEWRYLFFTRSVTNSLSSGARYVHATIGGIHKGMILFPDNYTHPAGTGFVAASEHYNTSSNFAATVSLDGWDLMQKAGCVFLPLTGWRANGASFESVGVGGYYFTAIGDTDNSARDFKFSATNGVSFEGSRRCRGMAVRLARDVVD